MAEAVSPPPAVNLPDHGDPASPTLREESTCLVASSDYTVDDALTLDRLRLFTKEELLPQFEKMMHTELKLALRKQASKNKMLFPKAMTENMADVMSDCNPLTKSTPVEKYPRSPSTCGSIEENVALPLELPKKRDVEVQLPPDSTSRPLAWVDEPKDTDASTSRLNHNHSHNGNGKKVHFRVGGDSVPGFKAVEHHASGSDSPSFKADFDEEEFVMTRSEALNYFGAGKDGWQTFLPTSVQARTERIFAIFSDESPIQAFRKRGRNSLSARLLRRCRYLIHSSYVLDTILLVWSVQDAAIYANENSADISSGIPDKPIIVGLTDMFALTYLILMSLRVFHERCSFFSQPLSWRVFNLFMAIVYVCQAISQHVAFDQRGHAYHRNFFTSIAMLRIFRVFQVVAQVDASLLVDRYQNLMLGDWVRELRAMLDALQGASYSLVSCALIVFAVLLIFATFFVDGALNHCVQHTCVAPAPGASVLETFGSVDKALLSLFKSIFGGDDWSSIYATLHCLGPAYQGLFLGYIVFAVLALLNIVTAVFVESTMSRSQNDRQLMTQKEKKTQKQFLQTMTSVFADIDKNGDGFIRLTELEDHAEKAEITALFRSVGVDVLQVNRFFRLLDTDQSGTIDIWEFMTGLQRLKGEARSLDIAMIREEVKVMRLALQDLIQCFASMSYESSGSVSHEISEDTGPREAAADEEKPSELLPDQLS